MGIFTGKNRIAKYDFDRAVNQLPRLSWKEKDYLQGLFERYAKDGYITEEELHRGLREMERDLSDTISADDVRMTKEYLL